MSTEITFNDLPAAISSIISQLDRIEAILQSKGLIKTEPEPPIKGIHELSLFLRISAPRAQKLKNENVFPYFQSGRKILFDPAKVREVWQNYPQRLKKRCNA